MDLVKPIIVTADVDLKLINKLLLSLRNWEYCDAPVWDDCRILRSTEDEVNVYQERNDIPPLRTMPTIEFRGKSLQEIETLALKDEEEKPRLAGNLYLILDQQGVEEATIIIMKRAVNLDEEAGPGDLYLDKYYKVRVPWFGVHTIWVNLRIGNMGFEDFCSVDEGDENGWFPYHGSVQEESGWQPLIEKRDTLLANIRQA